MKPGNLFIAITSFLLLSCGQQDFCDDGSIDYSFENNLQIITGQSDRTLTTPSGNYYPITELSSSSTVPSDEFLITLASAAVNPFALNITRFFSIPFPVSNANACSIAQGAIETLNITSDQNFSDSLPAGENLNSIFEIINLTDLPSGTSTSPIGLDTFVALNPISIYHAGLQLGLTENPTVSKTHRFTIEYKSSYYSRTFITSESITFE